MMEIQIKITASEILDRGCWDAFCELKGYNPWCINEGLMDSSESFTLTLDEAHQIGIKVSD